MTTEQKMRRRAKAWRKRADELETKVRANPHHYSERAIGEAQGYWRALRECADAIERSLGARSPTSASEATKPWTEYRGRNND